MTLPRLSTLPVPALLFVCMLIGGSVQWPLATLLIQLGAIALLLWAIMGGRQSQYRGEGMAPVWLAIAAILVGLAQLIPLPPFIWTHLPGREVVVEGYRQLGMALPWLPVSLIPSAAMPTLLPMLVPLSIYLAMLWREPPSASLLIGVILVATTLGAMLGVLQIKDGTQHYYPYPVSDWSSASGFFANPNHMGLLLLVAIPLAVGLGTDRWPTMTKRSARISLIALLGLVAIALATVIPLNGSLAIAILGGPVLIASAMIPDWGKHEYLRRAASALLTFAVLLATVGAYWARHILTSMGQTGFATRSEIWHVAWKAVDESFPFGTGPGTFERVYPLGENAAQVTAVYVNHAHNDYLELLIEGGAPMVVLIILFFVWWVRRARNDWLGKDNPALGRAAAIASCTILAHSFVDFPLRTPAIAALFGACLAMMVVAIRPKPVTNLGDLHRTRHTVVR